MKRYFTWVCVMLLVLPGLAALSPIAIAEDKILDPAWGSSTTNTLVSSSGYPEYYPKAVTSGSSGNVIVVWEEALSASNYDLYAQCLNSTGWPQWATKTTISNANNNQMAESIVPDGNGGAIIVWRDKRSGTTWDLYAQRVTTSGSVLWPANGLSVNSQPFDKSVPCAVADGAGGAFIFWSDSRNGNADIFGQHLDSTGIRKWAYNGTNICSRAGDQTLPVAISDGQGGSVVAWVDQSGTNNDIYAQRVNSAGTYLWTYNGNAVCFSSGDQGDPQIVLSSAGELIFAWVDDGFSASSDIFAQLLNLSSGTKQWSVWGEPVCTMDNVQDNIKMVPDNSGGAIVVWSDLRNGADSDIYAQRLNSNGATQWAANGTKVCSASSPQNQPDIIGDMNGGAVIAWYDLRNSFSTSADIYAQHIAPDGSSIWEDNGTAVCNANGIQASPGIVREQSGGAIVVWNDQRGSDYDIYAQRLFLDIDIFNRNPPKTINEDQLYYFDFDAKGIYAKWKLTTTTPWLSINEITGELSGTPLNEHVGNWPVDVTIKGLDIHHSYTITVKNVNDPPVINTIDTLTATEDVAYYCNYTATDPDPTADTMTWSLFTDAKFLSIGKTTGTLSGTPNNSDVGPHSVNVSASDGKGGLAWHVFTLTVNNVNDPPVINTTDVTTCDEDSPYNVAYVGYDPDPTLDDLTWELWTNASFLTLEQGNATLIGLPENEDVGIYWVNVSVNDGNGARAYHNFTLTVLNVNDAPVWTVVPNDRTMQDFETFIFDVNATDPDARDTLTYTVSSLPTSSISIDKHSGLIKWEPSETGDFAMLLTVTDGISTITHTFRINVLHTDNLPNADLLSPGNGSVLDITNPMLVWKGFDMDEDNLTYALYLSKNYDVVYLHQESARIAQAINYTAYTGLSGLLPDTTYYWTVVPYDGKFFGVCQSGVWSFSISPNATSNSPPRFTSTPALEARVGVEWSYAPTASDPDKGDMVFIEMVSGPESMVFEGGVLKWKPRPEQKGAQAVVLKAGDNKAYVLQEFTITVLDKLPDNLPPNVEQVLDAEAVEGTTLTLKIEAKDPENATLYYSLIAGPEGANVNSDGTFEWKVPKGSAGQYHVVIEVSDGAKNTTIEFDIDVKKEETATFGYWWLIALLVLLVVVVIVIVIVVLMRRKPKEEKPPEEASKPVVDAEVIEPAKTKGAAFQAYVPPQAPAQQEPQAQPPAQDMQPVRLWSQGPAATTQAAPEAQFAGTAHKMEIDDPYAAPTIEAEKKGPALAKPLLMLPPAMVLDLDDEERLNVDEVFLMTNEGLLLNHYVGNKSTQIDEDILSGMISAVQSFVRDSFKNRSELKMLRLGDYNMMIEKGKMVTVVVMTTMEDPKSLTDQIRSLIQDIEDTEGRKLKKWNGDVSVLKVLDEYTERFMKGEYGA